MDGNHQAGALKPFCKSELGVEAGAQYHLHMFANRLSAGPLTSPVRITALILLLIAGREVRADTEKDPHRPLCTSTGCRMIESFLKAHYCGESPFGNGPDDGCEIKPPREPRPGVDVMADYRCEWNETKRMAQCEQHRMPSSNIQSILVRELQRAGLPAKANGQTYFTVWKEVASGGSIALAYYSRPVGKSEIELCEVIVKIDQSSHVVVLRKLPFQKTDVDVLDVTQWSLVDLADVDGDGQVEVILEGDAYENHWLEVDSVKQGFSSTIFSGLGYYL